MKVKNVYDLKVGDLVTDDYGIYEITEDFSEFHNWIRMEVMEFESEESDNLVHTGKIIAALKWEVEGKMEVL